MANISVQMLKYSSGGVNDDLENLDKEIKDEEDLSEVLIADVAARTVAAKEFIEQKAEGIAKQHAQMKERTVLLAKMVDTNQSLEAANDDYKVLINSAEAVAVADQIAELSAMSDRYHQLLLNTGRAGRVPPPF
jgi:hypothetical protein